MARLLAGIALVLLAQSAWAGEITGVRRGVVYVSLGSADGVSEGTRLAAAGAVLEATEVGERQCATKVVEGATPPVGAVVDAPQQAQPETGRKPPRVLPAPERLAERAGDDLVRDLGALPRPKVVHAVGERPARETTIHGDVQVSWVGLFDTDPQQRQDLGLHAVRVRSRLTVGDMGGLPLSWAHDVGFRGDFGPNLGGRGGADSRPWVEARRAALTWAPAGATVSGGRLLMPLPVQGGILDGASVEADLGSVRLGAYGGLSPDLMDLAPAADVGRFGVSADWLGDLDAVDVQVSAAVGGSTWQGELDRTALSLSTGVFAGPLLTVLGDVTLDAWTQHNPADRPPVDLTEAFVVVQSRPLDWLTLDAHYAFSREALTRELAARWPELLETPAMEPSHVAWLQATVRPLPWLSVGQAGGAGFGAEWAEGWWLRSRLDLLRLPVTGTDLHVGYSWQQTVATRVQVASLRIGQPLTDEVQLTAGYAFVTSQLRRLDERYDQHEVEAGVSAWLPFGLTADVSGTVLLDEALGPVIVAAVHGGWRF